MKSIQPPCLTSEIKFSDRFLECYPHSFKRMNLRSFVDAIAIIHLDWVRHGSRQSWIYAPGGRVWRRIVADVDLVFRRFSKPDRALYLKFKIKFFTDYPALCAWFAPTLLKSWRRLANGFNFGSKHDFDTALSRYHQGLRNIRSRPATNNFWNLYPVIVRL